jgi:hypothetical protein
MDLNWSYIAGFFDGEGHATLSKHKLQAGITQAGEMGRVTLGEIRDFLIQYGIKARLYPKKQVTGHKKLYMLSFSPSSAESFLRSLLPYLRIKRTTAQDILRYRKMFPSLATSHLCREYRGRDRIRTHCKRGHPLVPENVYSYSGNRQCKICAYAIHQIWRKKKRQERKIA